MVARPRQPHVAVARTADHDLAERAGFLANRLDTLERLAQIGMGKPLTAERVAWLRTAYRVPADYQLPAPVRLRVQP